MNNSAEPVYAVVVGIVFVQGAGPHSLEDMLKLNQEQYQRRGPVTTVSILPGGLYRVWIAGTGWGHILSGRAGVEIAFSDAAGAHWVRRATGHLEELAVSPLEYLQPFGFYGPLPDAEASAGGVALLAPELEFGTEPWVLRRLRRPSRYCTSPGTSSSFRKSQQRCC